MKKHIVAKFWRWIGNGIVLGALGGPALVSLAQDAAPTFGVPKPPAAAPAPAADQAAAGAANAGAVQHPCVTPAQGMVAWLAAEQKPDDALANKVLADENVVYAPGKVGDAFDIRGAGIKIAAVPKLDVGTGAGFTLETWINPTDVRPMHPIFDFNNGTDFGVHFWIFSTTGASGALFANFQDTTGTAHIVTTQADTLKASEWQHVAMTYDKRTGIGMIYVNGLPAGQTQVGQFRPQTSYDLILGYRPGGLGKGMRFTGLMDEVSVYNRPLTESELRSIVQAGSAGKCQPQLAKAASNSAVTKATPTPLPTPTATPTPKPTPTLIPALKVRQPLAAFTFASSEGTAPEVATKIVDSLTEGLRKVGIQVKPRQHMDRVFSTTVEKNATTGAEAVKTTDAAAPGEAVAPALQDASRRRRAAQQMSANTILWGEVQQVSLAKGQAPRLTFVVRLIDATSGVALPEMSVSESLPTESAQLSADDALNELLIRAVASAVTRIRAVMAS